MTKKTWLIIVATTQAALEALRHILTSKRGKGV